MPKKREVTKTGPTKWDALEPNLQERTSRFVWDLNAYAYRIGAQKTPSDTGAKCHYHSAKRRRGELVFFLVRGAWLVDILGRHVLPSPSPSPVLAFDPNLHVLQSAGLLHGLGILRGSTCRRLLVNPMNALTI